MKAMCLPKYAVGFLSWFSLFSMIVSAADQEVQVWVCTEARRVLRHEPAKPLEVVQLAAAGNEWESFQVLLRSPSAVPGISVELTTLLGPDTHSIGKGHIRVFRQHQIEIKQGTFRNDAFEPGWYPDPLIPVEHPLTRKPLTGGRFIAMPFHLPAEETQGFWIDIFVPPGTPAGKYRGEVLVKSGGNPVGNVPVELMVWDFSLPRVSSWKTALGSPSQRMRDYYRLRARESKEPEPTDWAGIDRQCAELVSRHRINATPPSEWLRPVAKGEREFEIPSEYVEKLRGFINEFHVNALMVPHPSSVVKAPEAERERLFAWLAAFDRLAAALNRPEIVFYTYLRDEPNDAEAYEYVRRWGKVIREAQSVVKILVVEQPQPQDPSWGDLYGAVDIWCPLFSLFEEEPAAARRKLGETIWTYTALCQGPKTPWWHIDFPLLHYRVPAWISWRYRIEGILYWGGMSYWRQVEDPWLESWTYGRRETGRSLVYHGEGTLVYPARPVGYDGIVCSLRLKALRDAIEDYEYLVLASRLANEQAVDGLVRQVARSWFDWDPEPRRYDELRRQAAELIERSSRRSGN